MVAVKAASDTGDVLSIQHVTPDGASEIMGRPIRPGTVFAWVDARTLLVLVPSDDRTIELTWLVDGVAENGPSTRPVSLPDTFRVLAGNGDAPAVVERSVDVGPKGAIWLEHCVVPLGEDVVPLGEERCKQRWFERIDVIGGKPTQRRPKGLRAAHRTHSRHSVLPPPSPLAKAPAGVKVRLGEILMTDVTGAALPQRQRARGFTCSSAHQTTTWPVERFLEEEWRIPKRITWIRERPPLFYATNDDGSQTYFRACSWMHYEYFTQVDAHLWAAAEFEPGDESWLWSLYFDDEKLATLPATVDAVEIAPTPQPGRP
jgi:hypothetical protein